VGIVFQSDRVSAFFEKCMPYGMLYVFGRGRDKEYASIPTLFPALKLRKIREAVDGARRPPEDLPDLKNVPTEADLLRKVAEGAGITGDAVGGGPVG
jgi:hypothetical protein